MMMLWLVISDVTIFGFCYELACELKLSELINENFVEICTCSLLKGKLNESKGFYDYFGLIGQIKSLDMFH